MALTQAVAANVQAKLTFSFELEAISILLGLLSKCFDMASQTETPAEYLSEHYDPSTDTFDSQTMNAVYPQTCKAIRLNHRKNGGKRLRDYLRIEINDVSKETLKQAMAQPAHVAMAVLSETPDYGDDDESTGY